MKTFTEDTRIDEDAWIKEMAEGEANAFVMAGCLALPAHEEQIAKNAAVVAARLSFSKLVEHARLRLQLTKEQFAVKTRIPLEELVCIEEDDAYTPNLRTIHLLSMFLNVSHMKLLTVAGLAKPKDAGFYAASVRYAAKSQPVRRLTREEQDAFDEYVKFLSDN